MIANSVVLTHLTRGVCAGLRLNWL